MQERQETTVTNNSLNSVAELVGLYTYAGTFVLT